MTDIQGDAARTRATAKSATAFRTISEVSIDLEVPQHVLRFWETKFPQIKPLKRGGGRRYYRPDDVDLLRRIQSLLYQDGYTIKGVQRLLKEARSLAGLPPPGTPMPSLFDEEGDEESADDIPALPGLGSPTNGDDEWITPTSVRIQTQLTPEMRELLSSTLMDLLAARRLLD